MRIPRGRYYKETIDWAKHELEWRDLDGRWLFLAELLEEQRNLYQELAVVRGRLLAVREIVAPHTGYYAWMKGLNPRVNLDRWIHNQRLRNSTML